MSKSIIVRGAREHNLQNVNVEIPRNKLVVITGVSGSGKSSLAFDTIYAEGQRRYVESLSSYARQFLEMMQKPDVDSIEGLSPAISIEQKTTSRNPRSTVGTVTEVYDYMRLLFARIGIPYSPETGLPIASQTVSQMVDKILDMPEGSRLYLLAPVIRGRKGEYKREMAELRKRGFQRVKIDGTLYDLESVPVLKKNLKHDISVVVDRLVVKGNISSRLADSLETALELTGGIAIIENADDASTQVFSAKFACPISGFTIDEIEPRLFSFNNPAGACPGCDGLGTSMFFDPDLVVPDTSVSLRDGAIVPWSENNSPFYAQTVESIANHFNISVNSRFSELGLDIQNVILWGSGDEAIKMTYMDGKEAYSIVKPFEGVIENMQRRFRETGSSRLREDLAKFQSVSPCQVCSGQRLRQEALAVKLNGKHISDVTSMSILEARKWFSSLPNSLTEKQATISARVLKEINDRLGFLVDVGLEYLTLSRSSRTLSGGESQRIRLASQIGSGLTGVLYVLDEPSIGLHQRDNARLLETLKRLRDQGNTVIVVEHDEDAIKTADYLLDLGPKAGTLGGRVVEKGSPQSIIKRNKSLTAQYLTGKRKINIPDTRRSGKNGQYIEIIGANGNNLRSLNAQIPLGTLTCVTGVSGSGKSTLVIDTLYKAVARRLHGSRSLPAPYKEIQGLEYLDKVVEIDQSPIGRTPRSNPATYTGAFSPIREWFSGLPEARARGYKPGRFSFNVKGGRCEACQGDGLLKIEMHFLPDVFVECDVCKGKRYNRETLEIEFRGKSIADVLGMTVDNGVDFFKAVPSIREKLSMLCQVGLGYINVGQAATTLSGGEAQRVKLSKELARRSTGKTLYILDEPTTGLHFEDVKKLLDVLHNLVEAGNTVIVIEHNLEVIKTADWVVDLGPGGGNKGGEIVVLGTPEDVVSHKSSFTGKYLFDVLNPKLSNIT